MKRNDPDAYERLTDDVADTIIREHIDIGHIAYVLQWVKDMEEPPLKKEQVVEALARLVLELRNDIGSYDTIVGDDASGRLLAIFLRDIAMEARLREGKNGVQTYFMNRGRKVDEYTTQAASEYIASRKEEFGKVLLVTEYIQFGDSIRRFSKTFRESGVPFDIAALSIMNTRLIFTKEAYAKRIRYGSVNDDSDSAFYGKKKRGGAGVVNTEGQERVSLSSHAKRSYENPEEVRLARTDMKYLARELSKLLEVKI